MKEKSIEQNEKILRDDKDVHHDDRTEMSAEEFDALSKYLFAYPYPFMPIMVDLSFVIDGFKQMINNWKQRKSAKKHDDEPV